MRLPPEPPPAEADEAETWSPRPLTVEELRARFREEARGPVRAIAGTPVDRRGRRLTDFDLVEQEERQRMPEPIPTSWQSPVMPAPPSALLRHMSGGLLGLTLGLAIAVPGVLWYKGRIDPLAYVGMTAADLGRAVAAPSPAPRADNQEPAAIPRAATAKVDVMPPAPPVEESARQVASVPTPPPLATTPPAPLVTPAPAPRPLAVPRYEPSPSPLTMVKPVPVDIITTTAPSPQVKPEVAILQDARRLIGEGDFIAARRVLQSEAVAKVPDARFLLAETYDPNFLAARGVRSVRAEVPRAIEFYKEALAGGIDAARQRLTALRP